MTEPRTTLRGRRVSGSSGAGPGLRFGYKAGQILPERKRGLITLCQLTGAVGMLA